LTIDPRDEMLRFLREHQPYPVREYFSKGAAAVSQFEDVLTTAGRSYHQIDSILEFACGYGRMTRFLVHQMPRHKITVSDIDARAVDFTARTFGVRGFYSVSDAKELRWAERYDAVLVVSLFSHLTLSVWTPWLKRLYELLNPKGLLLFTTHGLHAYKQLPPEAKALAKQACPGFWFSTFNETHGRLPTDYYGTAYVTDSFVREVVSTHDVGELVGFYAAKLNGFQDVYAIQRP